MKLSTFHMFERAARWLDVHNPTGFCIRAPESIILGVNNMCNLHCLMCDVGTGSAETNFGRSLTGTMPLNMPLDLLRTIIDEASRFAPKSEIGFAFTEPGIYPHLIQGLAHAKSRGMSVSLTTNGTTLAKLAPDLAAAGLDRLHVSLDGPPEIHDRIRGRTGSFDAARDGVFSIHGIRGMPIDLYFAVTNENFDRIVDFAESVRNWPLVSATVMHTNFVTAEMAARHNERYGHLYHGTVSSAAAFAPTRIDVDALSNQLLEVTRPGRYQFPVLVQPPLVSPSQLHTYYFAHGAPLGRRCIDPLKYLMIKSNGEVIAAHGRCYNVRVGNLREQRMRDIWNSGEFRRFRRTLRREGGLLPACTRCCGAFSR